MISKVENLYNKEKLKNGILQLMKDSLDVFRISLYYVKFKQLGINRCLAARKKITKKVIKENCQDYIELQYN